VFTIRLVQWLGWVFETQERKKWKDMISPFVYYLKLGKERNKDLIVGTCQPEDVCQPTNIVNGRPSNTTGSAKARNSFLGPTWLIRCSPPAYSPMSKLGIYYPRKKERKTANLPQVQWLSWVCATKKQRKIFFGCYATTQLALQLHQERSQVVCSNLVGKPGSARPEGTSAIDLELKGIRTHMWTNKIEIE